MVVAKRLKKNSSLRSGTHSPFTGVIVKRDSHLYGTVRLQEQVLAADAAVDAAQSHVYAEREEVAVVEMAHAVVQPGWKHVQLNLCKVENF